MLTKSIQIVVTSILEKYICYPVKKGPSQGFHKLSATQENQYCHLCFSFAIRNSLNHWSIQSWNIIILYPGMPNFAFTNKIWLE